MQRMKRSGSKLLCILLLLSLLLSLTACGKPETQLEKTAGYLQAQNAEPGTGSVGGDWLIFGLARSGVKVPQKYFDAYYENVEAAVREKNGVLSDRKYTEYSRTVLALTAIGKNPADVAGFDLLKPLADFEQVTRQGINGTIFALLALDSGNYEIPENPDAAVQATRQMYVDELLARALPDGGWTLTGGEPDVDITAMTLQALAKYRDQADVTAAVERGLAVLSSLQEPDGGYVSWGSSNSESVAQVIVALTELGVPLDDERFTKNGITVEDALLRFAQENGAFVHVRAGSGGDAAAYAAEQYAGTTASDSVTAEVDSELDESPAHYEVELHTAWGEFEYLVDAYTGKVLSGQKDLLATAPAGDEAAKPTAPSGGADIGHAKAKSIALNHAGVSENKAYDMEIELDDEDGTLVYEVEFKSSGMEYSYEINAATGAILEHETEIDD